ncbi:unnamed protein product, partial [Didymodactylos carnosus]
SDDESDDFDWNDLKSRINQPRSTFKFQPQIQQDDSVSRNVSLAVCVPNPTKFY